MLGRLMKYEWKATWKLLLPMNMLIIVMTFLACVTVRADIFNSDNDMMVFGAMIILLTYIGSMFVVCIGTAIFLIYRFYTSVYGDQGYLLHTLPVDKHHIIVAKVLVSTGWILAGMALMYASVVFLFTERGEFLADFIDTFGGMIEYWGGAGMSGFVFLMTLVSVVFSVFARVLKVTACISIGQLSPNHKLLTAFAFYYGIYFAQKILSVFYFALIEMVNNLLDIDRFSYFDNSWEETLISGILYSVVFYLITWYMMEKKLNLD